MRVFDLSVRILFALRYHIRLIRALPDIHQRRNMVQIKLIALKLAMSFSKSRKEMLTYFLSADPQILQSILDLLKFGRAVPVNVQVHALKALRKLAQSNQVTTKLRDLGVLQDGLVPSLVQECLQNIGVKEAGGTSPDFVRFSESLLGFVEQLVTSSPVFSTYSTSLGA